MIHRIIEIVFTGDITDQEVLHQVALEAGLKIMNRIFKVDGVIVQQFRPEKPSKAQAEMRENRENWLAHKLHHWFDGQEEMLSMGVRWGVQFRCVEMDDAFYIFQRHYTR